MDFIKAIIDFILHIDDHLIELTANYGLWIYAILFLIVFCETGLVVTPFLPGDSLLFAAGAIAAMPGSELNVLIMGSVILVAAIIGDTVNYHIGKYVGVKVFTRDYKLIKREHLEKTRVFYEKHGGKTIIYARFVPIIRTFAPFVAGVGTMNYSKFIGFNISGAVIWTVLFVGAGYLFGNLPIIRDNFSTVILGIIAISLIPVVLEFFRHRKAS